jgi:hypothetical protein
VTIAGYQDHDSHNTGERHCQEEKGLRNVEHGIREFVESIKAGFRPDAVREELALLEPREKELTATLASMAGNPVRLHPNLVAGYCGKFEQLRETLD